MSVDQVISVPTLLVSIISGICSVYTFIFACRVEYKLRHDTKGNVISKRSYDYMVICIILVMITCDFFLVIIYALNFILDDIASLHLLCSFIAVSLQFLQLYRYLLHIVFASYLLNILLETSNARSRHSTYYLYYLTTRKQFIFMLLFLFVMSAFFTAVPAVVPGSYSHISLYYDAHDHGHGTICIIKNDLQYILFSFAACESLFSVSVLFLAIRKYYKNERHLSAAFWYLIKQLLSWVVLFSVMGLFIGVYLMVVLNLTDRSSEDAPLWLVIMANCMVSAVGIANAIAWYLMQTFKARFNYHIYKSRTQYRKQKAQMEMVHAKQQVGSGPKMNAEQNDHDNQMKMVPLSMTEVTGMFTDTSQQAGFPREVRNPNESYDTTSLAYHDSTNAVTIATTNTYITSFYDVSSPSNMASEVTRVSSK